ncbi:MAG: hypothetical protein OXC91_01375 [Rhodobacteraceae bacterium]|nr:hypothetical protein [Paracoccaceae bacterium]
MSWISLFVVVLALGGAGIVQAVDSTGLAGSLQTTKRAEVSIVGNVRDGMTCRYLGSDGKIHCTFSNDSGQGYRVARTIQPAYSRFQQNRPGAG